MMRIGAEGEFRSNLHRGGQAVAVKITPEDRTTAIRAARTMGLNVAGVDLLRSNHGPVVMEVNSSPGLEGIESATGKDIYAKRYGTAGMGKGPEFMVNSTLTGDQAEPSVTSDKYDNLYVTWSSYNQDSSGDWGVYGQQYSTSGAPINGEFRVNTTTSGHQKNPTAIMDSAGYLTVIWGGTGSGDSDGVFKQRYSVTTSQEKPPEGDILEVGTPPAKRKAAPARSRRTRAVIAPPAPRPTHPPEDDHHHHSMIPHAGQPAAHRPLARTVSAPSTAASTPSSAMTTQTASGESSSGANTAANDLFVWLAAPAKQTSRPA